MAGEQGVGKAPGGRPEEESDEPEIGVGVPRRRLWPGLVLMLALALAGGWFVYHQVTAPQPLRVLVDVEVDGHWWEGSRPAAALADEAAELLTALGLEPVRAGDPETATILENAASPREAARRLRAAYVITGRLSPAVEELPVAEGFVQVAVDDAVSVARVDEPAPLTEVTIHTFSGAKDEERALVLVGRSAARHIVDAAVPAIASHPEVAALVEGQDARLLDRLAPLQAYLATRRATLEDAAKNYAELDRSRRENEQRGPLTFHSPVDANDRLLATGERGILVATAEVRPFLSAIQLELLRSEALEEVGWRPAEGATEGLRETLWRGYSAFTYPSASRDGRRVALVEDLFGWGRSLVLVEEGKPPRRLRTEATRKLSGPRLAPDGGHVALVDRACARCARELSVVDADTGQERLHLGEAMAVGTFAWLDRSRLVVVMAPENGEPGLWVVPIASGRRRSLMDVEGAVTLRDPVATLDARTVAASNPIRRTILTVDVATGETTTHLVGGAATALAFSPDGTRLVFELMTPESRHLEIATLTLASSEVKLLTTNDAPDRYPLFSPDGARVFFEARNPDPVFGRKRAVARITSVPAP